MSNDISGWNPEEVARVTCGRCGLTIAQLETNSSGGVYLSKLPPEGLRPKPREATCEHWWELDPYRVKRAIRKHLAGGRLEVIPTGPPDTPEDPR